MKKTVKFLVLSSMVVSSLAVSSVALADTNQPEQKGPGMARMMAHIPGVFGTVSAISGSTLTVQSKGPGGKADATVYTVDASKATVDKNGDASTLSSVVVGDTVMVAGTVSGSNVVATTIRDGALVRGMGEMRDDMKGKMKPEVMGTVVSISGNTITVTAKKGEKGTTTGTTYTVDATNAKVMKAGASSTVAGIAVGDTIAVQGILTGTNVVATTIRDGVPPQGERPTMPTIKGDGQPIVGGKVTTISGSSLTITNASNVTYTVDASKATILKGPAAATLSSVVVGDMVVVQGAVNGSAITATSVVDQGVEKTKSGSSDANSNGSGDNQNPKPFMGGFLKGMGGFFQHMFGF